jgi:hypothetical protein
LRITARQCAAVVAGTERFGLGRSNFRSQLVAELAQGVLVALDLAIVLDCLRGEPVHDTEDTEEEMAR